MTFLKGLFRKGKKQVEENTVEQLAWINASENPWNIPLLDLRPISEKMLSSSKDRQMAENALSYNSEDGRVFWGQTPYSEKEIRSNIALSIDGKLEPGGIIYPGSDGA